MASLFLSYFLHMIPLAHCVKLREMRRKEGFTNDDKQWNVASTRREHPLSDAGTGPIILLVHGGGGDADKFHHAANHLANWYTVVTTIAAAIPAAISPIRLRITVWKHTATMLTVF